MTDLLSILGLEDTPAPANDVFSATAESTAAVDRRTMPETALNLDQWGMRAGVELLASSDTVRKMLDGREDAEALAADVFGMLFEYEPKLNDSCRDSARLAFVRAFLDSPAGREMRVDTMLQPLHAEAAAEGIVRTYLKHHPEPEPATGAPGGSESGDDGSEARAIRAMAEAAHAAADAETCLQETIDAEESLKNDFIGRGMGGDGSPGARDLEFERLKAAVAKVRNSKTLAKICELAGRYRRVAAARQQQKTRHGFDDMIGIELSGDLARIVPSELAALCDDDLEWDALRRLVENQMLSREFEGYEKLARGPIVVTVDESGSMEGARVENAKAIALALAWIANRQNRWCCLIGYSGGCQMNTLILKPGIPANHDELMKWLTHFWDYGSYLDVPVDLLPLAWDDLGCPKGKTDIISITDASMHVDADILEAFLEFKARERVTQHTIVIGSPGREYAEASKISDVMHVVPVLGADDEKIAEVLSI